MVRVRLGVSVLGTERDIVMHELTEKIDLYRSGFAKSKEYVDSIIRTYLSEKANKLSGIFPKPHLSHKERADLFGEFLGLSSDSPEPCHPKLHDLVNIYGKVKCEKCGNYYDPKPKDSEKWCKHWKNPDGYWEIVRNGNPDDEVGSHIDKIKFCQVCGAEKPRPAPVKTLEEKIDEFLRSPDRENDFHGKGYLIEKMAREHFNQNKV